LHDDVAILSDNQCENNVAACCLHLVAVPRPCCSAAPQLKLEGEQMTKIFCLVLSALWLSVGGAFAQCAVPNNLTNGTNADATQVMANFNALLSCVNTNGALRGYLNGFTLANDATNPNTVIDIGAGLATSDDATTAMALATAITKNANAAWTVGGTNGCLDSGSALTASATYHLFTIERTDTAVVDVLCSLSPSSPALPTSYTKKRRIGSFKTDASSHIRLFTQFGSEFLWKTPVSSVLTSNPGTTAVLAPLDVPAGVQVFARFALGFAGPSGSAAFLLLTSPDQVDTTPSAAAFTTAVVPSGVSYPGILNVRTDTSGRVRYRCDTSDTVTTVRMITYGWVDQL
jgi:hypothetical protein